MLGFFRLNEGQALGNGEVVKKLKISDGIAVRELKHLVELSYLERVGAGRSTVYKLITK